MVSLSRAAWSVEPPEIEAGQCTHCRTGSSVPATTPSTKTQGNAAEKRRLQGVR
jgi:hypothetical protein